MDEVLPKMKKLALNNSETHFYKAENCFQNAEIRCQNTKTALSHIFFPRPWMDSAQKSMYGQFCAGAVLASMIAFGGKIRTTLIGSRLM